MSPDIETPAGADTSLSKLPGSLDLTFTPGGDPGQSQVMEAWIASLLREAGGKLTCSSQEFAEAPPWLPALTLGTAGTGTVLYHFVPDGTEVAPFRELLLELAGRKLHAERSTQQATRLVGHAQMLLYVQSQCPNCPHAVRTLHRMTLDHPGLTLHLMDPRDHPEAVAAHRVKAVPALILDNELRLVGTLNRDHLLTLLGDPASSDTHRARIRQLIEQGDAAKVGAWIAEGNDPAFLVEQLDRTTLSSRIGLFLALEEALELNPRSLDALVSHLAPRLRAKEAALRGDVADLLGKIGNPEALPDLNALCEHEPDEDVLEAAREAIESIRDR